MDFAFKTMEFVFKMMDFVLKMMDFVSKTMDLQGVGLSRGSGPSRQVRTPRNLSSFLIQNPACLPHNPSFLMQYSSFIRNIAPQSLFENHTHTHTHTLQLTCYYHHCHLIVDRCRLSLARSHGGLREVYVGYQVQVVEDRARSSKM